MISKITAAKWTHFETQYVNWNDSKTSHVSWFLEDSVQYCKWVKWIDYSCVFEDLCDYLTVLLWNEAVRSTDHGFWKFLINIRIFVFWLGCWTLTPGSHSASTPPNQLGTWLRIFWIELYHDWLNMIEENQSNFWNPQLIESVVSSFCSLHFTGLVLGIADPIWPACFPQLWNMRK